MADRVLTWFIRDSSDLAWLPRYYADADYEKVALRVYATKPPVTGDLKIDIQADGVSIFANTPTLTFGTQGQRTTTPTETDVLNKGDTSEDDADDFNGSVIEENTWVTCVVASLAGAKGVTISLELDKVGEANGE